MDETKQQLSTSNNNSAFSLMVQDLANSGLAIEESEFYGAYESAYYSDNICKYCIDELKDPQCEICQDPKTCLKCKSDEYTPVKYWDGNTRCFPCSSKFGS